MATALEKQYNNINFIPPPGPHVDWFRFTTIVSIYSTPYLFCNKPINNDTALVGISIQLSLIFWVNVLSNKYGNGHFDLDHRLTMKLKTRVKFHQNLMNDEAVPVMRTKCADIQTDMSARVAQNILPLYHDGHNSIV